jgi:hypothetical protein
MNVDVGLWARLNRLIVLLLFVACLGGVAVWYRPLILRNEGMRRAILQLDQGIRLEEERARDLTRALRAMQDPRTVERLLRELGYARPDEFVVRFEPEGKAPTSPTR